MICAKLLQTVLLSAFAWVTACMHAAPATPLPRLPAHAVEYVDSSGTYVRWWGDVERCAGRAAPFAFKRVKFYMVMSDSRGLRVANGHVVAGLTYIRLRAVVIASPYVFDAMLLRHEMLHLVASPTHDPEYFQRRCRGVVVCAGSCISDTLR